MVSNAFRYCSQINTYPREIISLLTNLNVFNKFFSPRNCIFFRIFFFFGRYYLPKMLNWVYLVNPIILSCKLKSRSLAKNLHLNVLFHYKPMLWTTHSFTEKLFIEKYFNRKYLFVKNERQKAFFLFTFVCVCVSGIWQDSVLLCLSCISMKCITFHAAFVFPVWSTAPFMKQSLTLLLLNCGIDVPI